MNGSVDRVAYILSSKCVLYFSRNRVCLSRIWDAHESEKITLLFTRRYLESRKWYRDKRKTALKYKISRFQRSLTRWPEVISFEVTTIQSFSNFNRIKRSRITGEKLLFLSFSSNEDRRFEVFLILFSFKENHFFLDKKQKHTRHEKYVYLHKYPFNLHQYLNLISFPSWNWKEESAAKQRHTACYNRWFTDEFQRAAARRFHRQ